MKNDNKDKEIEVVDIIGGVVEENKGLNPNRDTNTDSDSSKNNNSNNSDVFGLGGLDNIGNMGEAFGLSGLFDTTTNSGSGDVFEDIVNWLSDKDKLPSSPLSSYLSNYYVKAEFAMYFYLISSLSRLRNLFDFISASEAVIFNSDDVPNLNNDELKERHDKAFKSLETTLDSCRKILYGFYRVKKDTSVDKLQLLLNSLPTNKIQELLKLLK